MTHPQTYYCRRGCGNTGLVSVPLVLLDPKTGELTQPQIPRYKPSNSKTMEWEEWPTPRPVMTTVVCTCGHNQRWTRNSLTTLEGKEVNRMTLDQYELTLNPDWRSQLWQVKIQELKEFYQRNKDRSPFRDIPPDEGYARRNEDGAALEYGKKFLNGWDIITYARLHPHYQILGQLTFALVDDIIDYHREKTGQAPIRRPQR